MKRLVLLIGAWGVLLAADDARAQTAFPGLEATLQPGDAIFITDESGSRTSGTLEAIGTSIRLSVDGVSREWLPQQVREIRRRGDSLMNGLKIGLACGGAAGVVFGLGAAAILRNEGQESVGPFMAVLGLGLGAGAAIGVGLDAAIPGSTVVYRRPPGTVSLSPVVTPTTQALRVALSF
jgi:hypothetical protein